MGFRFSLARQPQITHEGDEHGLIRFGWDYQFEHEHGLAPSLINAVSSGAVTAIEVGQCFRIASWRETTVKATPHNYAGIWLNCGYDHLDPSALEALGQRVWEREGPMRPSTAGVEVAWFDSAALICLRGGARLLTSLRAKEAVLGLARPIDRVHGDQRPEPFIATSAAFARSVLGAVAVTPKVT